MSQEVVWEVLENETQKENIKKCPGRFIGVVGEAGLESLVFQVLDGLLAIANDASKSQLSIELAPDRFNFFLASEKGLALNKEKGLLSSTYTFLPILRALSEQMGFSVEKDGRRMIHIYQQGRLVKKAFIPSDSDQQKIEIAFSPDPTIFNTQRISYFVLFKRCQQLAMLNSGLDMALIDGKEQKNHFKYTNGLTEYIYQNDHRITREGRPLTFHVKDNELEMEAVISKNSSASISASFVNGHLPIEGGTHLDGFIQGTMEAMNQFLEETNRIKFLTKESFAERFDFILSIHIQRPRYQGVVKTKIRNPELYKVTQNIAFNEISRFLKRHPNWYSNER
ncbi:hypothetical protein QQG09_01010 [Melissococcus plutonius]|uniref:DNA topoisomerase (ATP-hydrolyzing) n=2 Tax=Melissococcus plutonius TaxID=33970 RepID=F3YC47_MELPT|nr:hypothetical protein [Melissococcus plutonius]BAL61681.1 hypothetical protein MPD5_0406 [Melissococcus plutonius DAT561]AIM25949.1 DNA gyrase subunit B [Melissococcus plutonius S1]KMT24018.1 DNA gyrase subunit B [Melissococcus plutonius]KMT24172.1 DNA gyrase subunit B [Melissococcus plutonius]KMT25517.1 DNA gyrase subunit B [Melissococcus plutonius]